MGAVVAVAQSDHRYPFPPDDLESLGHFPPRTQCRNALRFECLLIHKHHFLPRHTLKVRRVLVRSERAEPRREVVQYYRVEIFFVFLRAALVISCGGWRRSTLAVGAEARRAASGPSRTTPPSIASTIPLQPRKSGYTTESKARLSEPTTSSGDLRREELHLW